MWRLICAVNEIPQPGARTAASAHGNIAVFRTEDNEVYALLDRCPHKGGPLSKGQVTGCRVECPLHEWIICLDDGNVVESDGDGSVRTFPVRIENGSVFIDD